MDFFNKTNCDRCGGSLKTRTTSTFNTQTICMGCKRKEEVHPSYEHAQKAEQAAVKRGNYNFPGVGLPPDLR